MSEQSASQPEVEGIVDHFDVDDSHNESDDGKPRNEPELDQDGRGKSFWHQQNLLAELRDGFLDAESSSIFTCGGTIPFSEEAPSANDPALKIEADNAVSKRKTVADPINLVWATKGLSSNDQQLRGLRFPVDEESSQRFEELVKRMEPATFGRGAKDVLDPSYRKAVKLDTDDFVSSFSPYDYGIIDEVAQLLLPSMHISDLHLRGVRAELYKLNVYSGPSGLFKAHVDTPRSVSQFGSLVVCLPFKHEGGQLAVRHGGNEVVYDWAAGAEPKIQWAAFYSDCEHEVMQVTSGHRITLTYNLFVTDAGHMATAGHSYRLETLPLYPKMKAMYSDPDFLPKGGHVGVICSHSYAHHSKAAIRTLPENLKGIDMAVWQVAKSLGLNVRLHQMLEQDYSVRLARAFGVKKILLRGEKFEDLPTGDGDESWRFYYSSIRRYTDDDCVSDVKDAVIFGSDNDYADLPNDWSMLLEPMQELQIANCGESGRKLADQVRIVLGKNILWANPPPPERSYSEAEGDTEAEGDIEEEQQAEEVDWKEPAVAMLTYGNESEVNFIYSRLVLIIHFPPARERTAEEVTGPDADLIVDKR